VTYTVLVRVTGGLVAGGGGGAGEAVVVFWRRNTCNSIGADDIAGGDGGTAVVRAGEGVTSPPKRMVRVQLRVEAMVVVREYLVTVRVRVSTVVTVWRGPGWGGRRVEVKIDVVGMSGGLGVVGVGMGVGATVTVTVTVVPPVTCFFTNTTGLASVDAATASRLKVLKRPILNGTGFFCLSFSL